MVGWDLNVQLLGALAILAQGFCARLLHEKFCFPTHPTLTVVTTARMDELAPAGAGSARTGRTPGEQLCPALRGVGEPALRSGTSLLMCYVLGVSKDCGLGHGAPFLALRWEKRA